jgi:amino acid adenylation domain-containing protein
MTSSPTQSATIVQLFDEQVSRTADATALVFADEPLTYRQVDSAANRLARHLQSMAVGPESLVGVFMDRSSEMVIALLAILKAGGAYVPLDPAYPGARIAQMVEDSGTKIILTAERVRPLLPRVSSRILSIDGEAATVAAHDSQPISCGAHGTNLAYVIYTSGSTGRPKGVMVEHRNVVSFFAAMDHVLGAEPGVWLAVTSISFDISVLELLWTLTRGFKVIVHGDEGTHTLASEITRHGVTHFQSTPSLARMLVADSRALAALGSVKTLLLGGEALPPSLVATLRPVIAGQIHNMYGPTETTVWSTAYSIPQAAQPSTVIPIGRPLSNTHAYVLDTELEPVPAGDAGELFLGGAGVVRGYWQRSELTAERFLTDPFAGEGRMYRTGDVARLLPDGNLEFLGRTDFQVKLRGFRIELGEIEAALEQCPTVRQAVVVAREFGGDENPGDKRLLAFCVPQDARQISADALRSELKSKLPEYMVPSYFIAVDQFPLTSNGKIDRNALPTIVDVAAGAVPEGSPGEGPRNVIERVIASVWAKALGVENVGLDANIFDLGVTSLMVPDVLIELQRQLAREIALVDLFEFHTVSSLAAHLAGETAAPQVANRGHRRRAARDRQGSL